MTTSINSKITIDVLTATAADLQDLFIKGHVRSVDLVDLYLRQIEQHNRQGLQLHAMIPTAPRIKLLEVAVSLDAERVQGKLRGAFYGVPIVVKVCSIWILL